jgi:hypothetical protein
MGLETLVVPSMELSSLRGEFPCMLLAHETMVVIRTNVDENLVGYIASFNGHYRLGGVKNKLDNILNYNLLILSYQQIHPNKLR